MAWIIFWLCAMIVLGVMEAATVGLVSIWFAGGALAALLGALLGAQFWLQLVLFAAVSGLLLLLLRPFAKGLLASKTVATNADRNIGKTALVLETIDHLKGTGRVKLGGVDWAAKSADGSCIPAGSKVQVLSIEGVKVCVRTCGVTENDLKGATL